jgi:citrate lyase subunit beta/citryl-CoA lyase
VKPYRSLLFLPGHKPDWVPKALRSGADAIILDLEDSVPVDGKPAARAVVLDSIQQVRKEDQSVGVFVRPNGWDTGLAGADLDGVVTEGLDGLLLPKVRHREDILRFDTLLTHFEHERGVEPGSIELIVSLETAAALSNCEEIAREPRVQSMVGGGARGADQARAVGYRWTGTGMETLYLRRRVILACRAAGISHPICSIWQDIADIDGLVHWAEMNRDLGFRGQLLIHPSHVEHANRIFAPTEQEVANNKALIAAFEAAVAEGHAAIKYKGEHIDYAHVATARELVARAEQLAADARSTAAGS